MKAKYRKHQHLFKLVETKKGLKARCSCGVFLKKEKVQALVAQAVPPTTD